MLNEHRHMVDTNRLSVLMAAVLLSYALARLIDVERSAITLQIFGIALPIPLNLTVITTFITTGLTAAGMDWLLRGHPYYQSRVSYQHWILPAATSLVLGVILYNLPAGTAWWTSFSIGGIILFFVFLAEYIALDETDLRYPAASAGLMTLSFVLFLILTATLAFVNARLLLIFLVVFPASAMLVLRNIHLRSGGWEFSWAGGIALTIVQIAAGLHYWPISPTQYGLALLGILYAMTGLALNLQESVSHRRAWIEATLGLAIFWTAAFFLKV